MRTVSTRFLGVLLFLCTAAVAHATQFPPGTGGTCPPDSMIVKGVRSQTGCTVATGDSVLGVGGIVTGIDAIPTGFSFYIQNRTVSANGSPYTGIDVFSGGTNLAAALGIVRGDSVVVYGKTSEFNNGTEILSNNNNFGSPNLVIRKISSGNTLPKIHVGTVNELQELTTNPNAEQWEGNLVKVNGPMRVVRNTAMGSGAFNSYLVVDDIVCPDGNPGPCDSLCIDPNTLAGGSPPANGNKVDLVQGIYEERTNPSGRGYRIQVRDANDISVSTPPGITEIFALAADTVRVVYDRAVTTGTAQDVNNYQDGSGRQVLSATLVESNAVHVALDNSSPNGPESVPTGALASMTVSGIRGSLNNLIMTAPVSRSFINGVLTIQDIQNPDGPSLGGACNDRSTFAGAGSAEGVRLTLRGVCDNGFGNIFYCSDAGGGARKGVACFAPLVALTEGHRYMWAGAVQEFFEETEVTRNVYLRDEGSASLIPAVDQPIAVLRDSSCDASQAYLSGEDFEGTLVRAVKAKILRTRGAGFSFVIANPTVPGDSITVFNNSSSYTFAATADHIVDVTGILHFAFGFFEIDPRNNADIIDFGAGQLGVGGGLPKELSFAIYPNPSIGRTSKVSLALPRKDNVHLTVQDVAGRRLAVIANGIFEAGTYKLEWNGLDAKGNAVSPGMYFYRLQVGTEDRVVRSIKLN